MPFLRLLPVLAAALIAVGTLSAPAALAASHDAFTKRGQPACTVTSTSSSSSSTTCTATLSGNNKSRNLMADVDVRGFAVFQCQTGGSTTTGQNQVPAETQTSTPIGTGSHVTFTTNPAVLTAPSTVSAQQAGCPNGSTPVNPTLTTTSITLRIDNGSILGPACTASNPNGLSGTVPLSC